MAPPSDDAITIYAQFMGEIKERLSAAAETVEHLRGGTYPFVHFIGAEFCVLQLRMIYELIALGSVAMHGKMGELREVYQADFLMKRLSELHPDFYPQPVTERLEGDTIHIQFVTGPYLTKDDLIQKYGRLGEKLHRGRSGDILFKKARVYDLDEVVEQLNLTMELLDYHYIALAAPGHLVRVAMSDTKTGEVTVSSWIPTG